MLRFSARQDVAPKALSMRVSADPATATDGAQGTWRGVTASGNKVTGVFDGSPAQVGGISPGDELLAVDGFRATSDSELRNLLVSRKIGEEVKFALFRRGRLLELPIVISSAPATRYEIATVGDPGPAAARYQAWLGEPWPGPGQILTTITTTARWV